MLDANVAAVLSRITPSDRVLDVGGWARCFNRADYVIDKFPFETRGAHYGGTLGLGPQGGASERFSAETWVARDLCDRMPWPFPDKFFDFCTCSHTLEDIRDPLWVCSEMRRVAKAGYIETPSMAFELTRGREAGVPVGLSHHFWLVEVEGSAITFHPKLHSLHGDRRLSLPPERGAALPPDRQVAWLLWEGDFEALEGWPHRGVIEAFVASFGPGNDGPEASAEERSAAADRRILELSRAADEARTLLWEARERLADAERQRDAARSLLVPIQGIGPGALDLARRLHAISARHPRLAVMLGRIFRAA